MRILDVVDVGSRSLVASFIRAFNLQLSVRLLGIPLRIHVKLSIANGLSFDVWHIVLTINQARHLTLIILDGRPDGATNERKPHRLDSKFSRL